MSLGFSPFAPAYAFIDNRLAVYLGDTTSNVVAQVQGPLRVAVVLYVILYGFAILRGAISEPIMDFAIRSLKLTLIYVIATTPAYSEWVTGPLFETLPNTIANAVGGSSGGNAGTAFDEFFARAAKLGERVAAKASLDDPQPLLVSIVVYAVAALACALGFGIVVLSKVALALIVALGPIFVACALFEATRRYFFGWLSQAVNYIVLFALIIAMFELVLSLIGSQWAAIDGQDPVAAGLVFIVLCLLGAIFFLQTPTMAAGIAGGASAGIADFGNAVGLRSHRPSSGQAAPRQSGRGGGAPAGSIHRGGR